LFLFGLDKRIDGKASSVDDFFSKVSEKLDKDNARILQQQVQIKTKIFVVKSEVFPVL
jgi:hypothetical protein